MSRVDRAVDVLVVGAGPAGLAAAAHLAAAGAGRVEVLERERQPGGVPRHSCHRAFGPRRRPVDGPRYAHHMVDAAVAAGAELRTGVTATGWAGPRTLETTGPGGLERITGRAVVLATGARERPRSARLVPGTRPAGVMTTGELQQEVHLHGRQAGTRAVVAGAAGGAAVALEAARTLRASGVPVVAVVLEDSRGPLQSPRNRFPVLTASDVVELTGRHRLAGVRVQGRDGGARLLACDTVVFTGDWIPDHELARRGGIALDPGTRGPRVDPDFRTDRQGVFAVGNLLHGVEPAVAAAAEGRRAATAVLRHLSGQEPWPQGGPPLHVDPPLLWIAPNRLLPGGPPPLGGCFTLRAAEHLAAPVLVVRQGERVLDRQRLPSSAVPGRAVHLRSGWTGAADPAGGPVHVGVMSETCRTPRGTPHTPEA